MFWNVEGGRGIEKFGWEGVKLQIKMQNNLHFYQKIHTYYINIYTGKNNYSKEFKIEN